MPFLNTFGAASAKSFGLSRKKGAVGQINYTSPGTYSFTVPSGATKVSLLAINPGNAGQAAGSGARRIFCPCYGGYVYFTYYRSGYGGAGGGLKYANSVSVVGGQVLTITIGTCGGVSNVTGLSCPTWVTRCGGAGGSSISVGECCYAWYGGGNLPGGGGGGAAGYNGAGGSGRNGCNTGGGFSGGGGGGNGGNSSGFGGAAAGGGGVGIYGYSATPSCYLGQGGSGGTNGGTYSGGTYGGGGAGGSYNSQSPGGPGAGGGGAVRILWTYTGGPTRAYPSTNVGDL